MNLLLVLLKKAVLLVFLSFLLFSCNWNQYATKTCVKRNEVITSLASGKTQKSFIVSEEETAFLYYDSCEGKLLSQYPSSTRGASIVSLNTVMASDVSDKVVIVRDFETDKIKFKFTYKSPIENIALSNNFFVVTTNTGKMFLYDTIDFKLQYKWTPKNIDILDADIAIDKTETYLIAGGSPSTMMGARWSPISIFNLKDLKPRPVKLIRKAHSGAVVDLIISDDNKYFVTTGKDRAVKVWSLPDGKLIHNIQHQRLIPAIAMSHNSKYLFTGGWNEKLKVWNLETKKMELEIDNGATIMSLLVSKDCSEVLTGDTDGYVKSRDLSGVLKCQ